jgi:PAS domain S-box-containing protein
MADESSDFLAAVDAEGRYLAVNRAYAEEFDRAFGVRPSVGMAVAEALAGMPDQRDRVVEMLRRARLGESFTVVQSFGRPERGRRLYEVAFRPFVDDDGEVRATYHVARDVTARTQAEDERELLRTTTAALTASSTFPDALGETLTRVCQLTDWATGEAWIPDPSGSRLQRAATAEHQEERLRRFHTRSAGAAFGYGEGLPGRVWRSGSGEWVQDVSTSPGFVRAEVAMQAGLRAAVAVPALADGEVVAVLCFYHDTVHPEDAALVELVSTVAAQLGLLIRRRRAEAELRRLTNQYEALLNHIPDLAWLKDRDSRYLAVNDAFLRAYGRTREAVLRGTDRDVYPPELAERYRSEDRRVLESGVPLVVEEREVTSGGGLRYLETIKTAFRDETGAVAGTVGIARDVTERKRREQQDRILARTGLVLASSLEVGDTLRDIVELLVPELGSWCVLDLVGPDGRFDTVEVAAEDRECEALIRSIRLKYPLEPEAEGGLMGSVVRGGEPLLIPRVTDDMLRTASRDEEHLSALRRLPLRSCMMVPMIARGRAVGLLTIATAGSRPAFVPRDLHLVQELGRYAALAIDNAVLYQTAQAAQLEAREAVRARDEVLGVVAHDLRNPLSALSMLIDILEVEGSASANVEAMQDITRQMDRLIQDLLDVRRMERGLLPLQRTCLPVHAALVRAGDLLEPVAAQREVRLELTSVEEDLRVHADADRVLQVLSNLVGNAIQVSPRGGRVIVRAEPSGNEVVFTVTDGGPGIPEDQIGEVFKEFWQSPDIRRGGAGLGLTIAKGIVESHGGRIWLESTVGRGTTFFFRLPVCVPGDRDSPAAHPPLPAAWTND